MFNFISDIMKKILLLMAMFACMNVMAQGNPIQCDSVIQAQGKNVAELYPMIKAWAAITYNSANAVIQMDDPQNGILICKGAFKYTAPGGMTYRYIDGWVTYTLKIQVRDERYKVTVGDFIHETSDLQYKKTWSFGLITDREKFKEKGLQDKRWTKTWPDLKIKSKMEFMTIIMSLSDATSGKSKILDTNDDW